MAFVAFLREKEKDGGWFHPNSWVVVGFSSHFWLVIVFSCFFITQFLVGGVVLFLIVGPNFTSLLVSFRFVSPEFWSGFASAPNVLFVWGFSPLGEHIMSLVLLFVFCLRVLGLVLSV